MKILKKVQKIPGGMMVVPLFLGALVNTFFPQALEIGSFTTALFKDGANALLGAFLFCSGSQINLQQGKKSVLKGSVLVITKVVIGAVLGLLVNRFFGKTGILGLTPLAIISALSNNNGGLYAGLAGEYGDETDIGATPITALSDGPFFTLLAFGATGLADVPFKSLLGALVPVLVGFVLGNIDEDIREFLAPGGSMLIPFFAFALGANLNFKSMLQAGLSGILLGVICTVVTGLAAYSVYKALGWENPQVAAAVGCTAGNAVGTPAIVAQIDPTWAPYADQATAQVATAIIVTAVLCPMLVSWLDKSEKKKDEEA